MYSAADYTRALQQLLPPGRALTRAGTANLTALLGALAEEFARVEQAGRNLFDEIDPRTTLLLLPDWERVLGLPDTCSGAIAGTVTERRAAIWAKLVATGGQTAAYFQQLAASMGYAVLISTYRPSRVGTRSGERIQSNAWAFAWKVEVLPAGSIPDGMASGGSMGVELRMRAGTARSGDRLRSFGTPQIECVINRAAPAHTVPIFTYPDAPVAAWSYDFTEGV